MTNIGDIHSWMEKFKTAWLEKDIDTVFDLLSDDVEYWETPFQKVGKGSGLRKAWEEVLPLQNMQLTYEIFVADESKGRYAVVWHFSHSERASAGTYLIELDDQGLCRYFHRTSMAKV